MLILHFSIPLPKCFNRYLTYTASPCSHAHTISFHFNAVLLRSKVTWKKAECGVRIQVWVPALHGTSERKFNVVGKCVPAKARMCKCKSWFFHFLAMTSDQLFKSYALVFSFGKWQWYQWYPHKVVRIKYLNRT